MFDDPHHLTLADPYPHEVRWRTIGAPFSASLVVLFVVHTDEEDAGRIISARRATAHERRAYEDAKF